MSINQFLATDRICPAEVFKGLQKPGLITAVAILLTTDHLAGIVSSRVKRAATAIGRVKIIIASIRREPGIGNGKNALR